MAVAIPAAPDPMTRTSQVASSSPACCCTLLLPSTSGTMLEGAVSFHNAALVAAAFSEGRLRSGMQLKVPNFEHTEYPVHIPPLRDGQEQNPAQNPAKVLIAGGGPVGLAMALALAKQNIPSVIVEMDRTVCAGSRAICLSRRSLEILERLGVL